jgi:NAD(P)-dependent dehydrogenase (short-subunit alcohol dehydrogenase family)
MSERGTGGAADLFSIRGKVALVTGGSRGIGLMIARGYVEAGARVYVASRKADVCREVAAELSKLGTCHALPADFSTEAETDRLAAELGEREPELHILVNNAGANWGAPLQEYPDAAWDKVLALNLKAVFHLTRVLAKQLAPAHITVNAIAPGPFESKMMEWMLDNFRAEIEASCPLGRIGEPDDMAGVAIYLASRAGAYVTGAVIPVDGGIATTR